MLVVAETDLVGALLPPSPMMMSWHQRTDADPAMRLFRDVIARAA